MSFASEKRQIKFPSRWYTIALILLTLVISWSCIYFDQARGAAYFTVPVVALLVWCAGADITYLKTPKIKMCVWALCLLYMIAGNAAMAQVLSVEAGTPMVTSGPIYEASVILARKKPQE